MLKKRSRRSDTCFRAETGEPVILAAAAHSWRFLSIGRSLERAN